MANTQHPKTARAGAGAIVGTQMQATSAHTTSALATRNIHATVLFMSPIIRPFAFFGRWHGFACHRPHPERLLSDSLQRIPVRDRRGGLPVEDGLRESLEYSFLYPVLHRPHVEIGRAHV